MLFYITINKISTARMFSVALLKSVSIGKSSPIHGIIGNHELIVEKTSQFYGTVLVRYDIITGLFSVLLLLIQFSVECKWMLL